MPSAQRLTCLVVLCILMAVPIGTACGSRGCMTVTGWSTLIALIEGALSGVR